MNVVQFLCQSGIGVDREVGRYHGDFAGGRDLFTQERRHAATMMVITQAGTVRHHGKVWQRSFLCNCEEVREIVWHKMYSSLDSSVIPTSVNEGRRFSCGI